MENDCNYSVLHPPEWPAASQSTASRDLDKPLRWGTAPTLPEAVIEKTDKVSQQH